jgi:protein-arginine kinase activator protein McsA
MQSSRFYRSEITEARSSRWNMVVKNDFNKYSEPYNQKDTHYSATSLSSSFSLDKCGSKRDNLDKILEIRFLLCNSCFWCASYYHNSSDKNRITKCPGCYSDELESMPISSREVYKFDYNPRRGITLEFSGGLEK